MVEAWESPRGVAVCVCVIGWGGWLLLLCVRAWYGRKIRLDHNSLSGTLAPDLWQGLTGLK